MTDRMLRPRRLNRTASFAVALIAGIVLAGCHPVSADDGLPGASAADIALIQQTMREVQGNYVEPVKPGDLTVGALKGMLTRLDPHSDYMDEREYRDLMATTSGEFGGVGIEISVDEGVPQVISAIEGTPAAAAGIGPGIASPRPTGNRSSAWISSRWSTGCVARREPRWC